jgi:hypothetical protein
VLDSLGEFIMTAASAGSRYNRRVLGLSVAYVVFLFGAQWLFGQHRIGGMAAYVVAVLPALPIVGVFAVIGRYLIEEQDEYLRMLMVRQSLVATGLTLAVVTVWGFLESFGLVPHVAAFYVAVLWFLCLGVGSIANRVWR